MKAQAWGLYHLKGELARLAFAFPLNGDTLWAISAKYYGAGAQYTKIYGANTDKISNPNLIYPGQVLTIP